LKGGKGSLARSACRARCSGVGRKSGRDRSLRS
jgi:hypothetical protein